MKKFFTILFSISLFTVSAEPQDLSTPAQEVTQLSRNNFQEIFNSPQPVVIDIYADWCGPCRRFAPTFKKANDQFGEKYRFVKLNADQERDLVQYFRITSFPTVLYLKNGGEVGRHIGLMDKHEFETELESYLGG